MVLLLTPRFTYQSFTDSCNTDAHLTLTSYCNGEITAIVFGDD